MTRAAWITDVHLDWVGEDGAAAFAAEVAATGAEVVLLTGDIADGRAEHFLELLARDIEAPIHFVLGNHDFYGRSVQEVKDAVRRTAERHPRLERMEGRRVVLLSERTALVGVDGWSDARLGNFAASPIRIRDYLEIRDLAELPDDAALEKRLRALGRIEADLLGEILPEALAAREQAVVLLHAPPFQEACWHEGRTADDDWAPHFTCGAAGEVLREVMTAHPGRSCTVLCGHCHSPGEYRPLENLVVRTGGAEYGAPGIVDVLDL